MKGRKGRTKQNAFLYLSEYARSPNCQSFNCSKPSSHFCKLCNKSLCEFCYKMEKVEDVFVVSGGEHKICNECYAEHQLMNKLYISQNLKFNSVSKFNIQLWIKDYNQKRVQLSSLYSELRKQEQYHSVEIDIENTHFNSSYHQFLIKTTEGLNFIDMKIAVKNVVNAFLHYNLKINYKKEIMYQAFYLLNYTDEVGAFTMMKFLYDHIIPQQLYQEDQEFIRNLTTTILESISLLYKNHLEYMPTVKALLQDRLSLWILSLFSFNFKYVISLHTLQQVFMSYSFESIVNSIITIIQIIYPYFKVINYNTDQSKLDGLLFQAVVFSQFKTKLQQVQSQEDYFKLIANKTNLNNEIWGNDYQQTLDNHKEHNKSLKLEIANLVEECKHYQKSIEEIQQKNLDYQFESVIIPFDDTSVQKKNIEQLKIEQDELLQMVNSKKEIVKNLTSTDDMIKQELEKLEASLQNENDVDEKELEKKYLEEEQELSNMIAELENRKKQKKELVDIITSELQQVNLALDLMKQLES